MTVFEPNSVDILLDKTSATEAGVWVEDDGTESSILVSEAGVPEFHLSQHLNYGLLSKYEPDFESDDGPYPSEWYSECVRFRLDIVVEVECSDGQTGYRSSEEFECFLAYQLGSEDEDDDEDAEEDDDWEEVGTFAVDWERQDTTLAVGIELVLPADPPIARVRVLTEGGVAIRAW